MFVIDRNTMRRAEQLAVDKGADWFGLMKNAGTVAAEFINKTTPVTGKRALILCGKGNNGGDGFVIAKEFSLCGGEVTVALTHGAPATESAKKAFEEMPKEIKIVTLPEAVDTRYDIVVDAVFGTGFTGKESKEFTDLLNSVSANTVYAVDIPSLMEADSGKGYENCLCADYTLTFAAYKYCHILPRCADRCGKVVCLDIGIDRSVLVEAGAKIKTTECLTLPKRQKTSCKNDYGVGLAVCGSYGMSGASIIAAKAALRSGIGILKLACVEQNYTACAVSVPEAVLVPCKSEEKTFGMSSAEQLKAELKRSDALLIGCGLGVSEQGALLVRELLKTTNIPTLLDADGINLIADDIELLKDVKAPLVLTPHPGEMARLLGVTPKDVEGDRIKIAENFAKEYGVYLILKGANTVIAAPDGEMWVNLKGNAGMATAGSGDMLAGIILALLSRGVAVTDAVSGGVALHSAAGDAAAKRLGENAMLPTDMIEELCRLI